MPDVWGTFYSDDLLTFSTGADTGAGASSETTISSVNKPVGDMWETTLEVHCSADASPGIGSIQIIDQRQDDPSLVE
jgi:hypothetical protein